MKILFVCPEYENTSRNLTKVLSMLGKNTAYFSLREADKNSWQK